MHYSNSDFRLKPRKSIQIAAKLNRELPVRGEQITPAQVALVMAGERCESHPVVSAIVREVIDPHERIRALIHKRAEDAPCFGGA